LNNSKYVIGIHNGDLKKINRRRYKQIFDFSDKIACRSQAIKKRFLQSFPEYEKKVFTANSGIDKKYIENYDFFKSKIEKWDKKENINIITVSSLVKVKNIDVNIRVLSKLKNYNWTYDIIGNGEEINYLKKLTKNYDLEDRIIFHGLLKRDEAINMMKKSDIFLMVSAPETFGLAYLEAMAKGNIVIGTKGWGIDGIVKNKVNGYLSRPRDEQNLFDILKEAFNLDNSKVEKILLNTYKTINEYTEEKMAKKYLENIYY